MVCLGCFDSFFNTGIPGWIFSSGLSFESGFAPALTIWVQPYQISDTSGIPQNQSHRTTTSQEVLGCYERGSGEVNNEIK